MKAGKYTRRKKNSGFKKSLVLLSCLLLACMTVGGTIAYLIDNTSSVENVFIPAEVQIEVDEDSFDGTEKKGVTISNPSGDTNVGAFVRARVVVSWQDETGNTLGETPSSADYSMEIGSGWIPKGEYYYWPSVVSAGSETGNLITVAKTLTESKVVEGNTYYLSINILASGIQADWAGAAEDHPVTKAWGVAYNASTKTIS